MDSYNFHIKKKTKSKFRVGPEEWYSVKIIFRHENLSDTKNTKIYEEKVIVLRAHSLEEAMNAGKKEGKRYSKLLGDVKYVGYVAAYRLCVETIEEGTEVYSLMRKSKLSKRQFIDRYYDDGTEHTQ